MKGWLIPITSPLGAVDYLLLLFVIYRIRLARIRERKNSSPARDLAGTCGVALAVAIIAFAIADGITFLLLLLVGRRQDSWFATLIAVVGPQIFMMVGVLVAFLTVLPLSRRFWPAAKGKSARVRK